MDKNTITGFLLIGALLIGMMWLNQPNPDSKNPMPAQELTEEQQDALDVAEIAAPSDSLTGAELAMLAQSVYTYGTPDSLGLSTISNSEITLSSNGTKVSGTVELPSGSRVELDQLTSGTLSASEANPAIAIVKNELRRLIQYQGFARYLNGSEQTIRLENELVALDFSTHGGVISSAELKKYDSFRGGNVKVINGDNDSYSFILTSSNREFDTREFFFTPVQENDSTILMTINPAGGSEFGLRYTLMPDSYVVRLEIVQSGMENIIPMNTVTMDFLWNQTMSRQEEGRMFEERNSAIYYKYAGGGVENLSEAKNDAEEVGERIKWIGYKNQFFSMAFIANGSFNRADFESKVLPRSNDNYLKEMHTVGTFDYSPMAPVAAKFDIFIGPNLYPMLKSLDDKLYPDENLELTRLVPLGWSLFRWINTWIVIPVFTILGEWFTNYGVIILLLTIFIKLIIFPFTYKSYMSQAKMRLLAPEIKEINDKYPGQENAMTRQQKTMEIYSRAGANPMSGCLPMLFQMPVLIAMFAFFPSAIELRGEPFLWAKDLSAPDAIISWTANIPLVTEYFGNHISLFCLLITVTNIIYTKITMANQPANSSMPGMKVMMYAMPIMFLVFFNNYAAGLSLYYFLSLLITIIQTYIFRRCINEDKMRARMAEAAKKPRKKSGFMARLEEAQRQQQAMLREQQKRKR